MRILSAIFMSSLLFSATPAFADVKMDRDRANSDDAKTTEEALFHGMARTFVIMKVQPNKLGVGGAEFRVKRNPVGKGCFVYDPRTQFSGVKRNLVWWVPEEGTAYAFNSPSKMVTPSLKWPRESSFEAPSTSEVVAYVFENKPMTPPKRSSKPSKSNSDSFSVKEYRIYRTILDTPMSVSDAQSLKNAAKRYGVTVDEAKKASRKVFTILHRNKWTGSPELEIKHASDWKGEKP